MRKLIMRREVVRLLDLRRVAGGQSQGAACDNTQGKTQCDFAGCAYCTGSCNACDQPISQPQSCQGCTND